MDTRNTVYIAGDSTAAMKEEAKRPETGWGECFPKYLGSEIRVDNRAMNGRSTRSFISEGRLESICNTLKAGDYLFIQFGHNDSKEDAERHTDPETEYPAFLQRYVDAALDAGAIPVLLTPVVRRHFDESGLLLDTHGPYLAAMKRFASTQRVPLLDLEARTRALVSRLGDQASRALYLQLLPNENPNYPEGVADNTHFCSEGADRVASLVAAEILISAPKYPELELLARSILLDNLRT